MKTSRRMFLKGGAIAFVSAGAFGGYGPQWLRSTAFAAEPNARRRKTLICIFQRGAVDGLSMVVPHGDPFYYQHRSAQGIAIPRNGRDGVIDLDGKFGLHPALNGLQSLWKDGHLAAVQAVGSPNPTRSHFDAQDYMEAGTPGDKSGADGWLSRALLACPEDAKKARTAFGGISMTSNLPRALQGGADALAIPDLKTFGVKDSSIAMPEMGNSGARTADGFEALYDGAVGDVLHGAGQESFEAMKMLESIKTQNYRPERAARYPNGRFGSSLQQIAQLIKADVGVEVAFAESGGWDTHVNQGSTQGNLARRLGEFGDGIKALYLDLGDRMSDVTILTMSEFGRTARQNGNGGTDHGHGTCFFVLGDKVNGGKVLGDWPGLAPEQLYENRDLAVTTDFRSIFGEVANKHLGVQNLSNVFPNFDVKTDNWRGVMRS